MTPEIKDFFYKFIPIAIFITIFIVSVLKAIFRNRYCPECKSILLPCHRNLGEEKYQAGWPSTSRHDPRFKFFIVAYRCKNCNKIYKFLNTLISNNFNKKDFVSSDIDDA